MDFFARQDRARAQTRQLIALFALAVGTVVVTLTVVLTGLVAGANEGVSVRWLLAHPQVPGAVALGLLTIILAGAGYKAMQLREGGAVVARAMGGDLVDAATRDPLKRRLLNVVEEMAIASGVPVPAVYVMDGEPGINAFAAGHTPGDAVVAVTRGALERFDRAELQGVVGHEFSHILNGDMRLNMRLLGFVAGLFAIAHVGRVLARSSPRSRKGGGGAAFAGVAMIGLGLLGVLLGRMIQAAISRQREFLADASAVQFTRDPQGLRDALVKVGASESGSRLDHSGTDEVAHMLFASGLSGMFASHPPLVERIRALDPGFQAGEFEQVAKTMQARIADVRAHALQEVAAMGLAPDTDPGAMPIGAVAPRVANPGPRDVAAATQRLAALPAAVRAATEDPTRAAIALWALLLAERDGPRERERGRLAAACGPDVAAAAAALRTELAPLGAEARLPLLLRLLPVLGRGPVAERERLLATIADVIGADGSISVFEFSLARLARVHLAEQLDPSRATGRATLLQLEADVQRVFSVLARSGHAAEGLAREAYERGMMRALPGRRLPLLGPDVGVATLDPALDRLDQLRPADKARLVDGLGMVAAHDRRLEIAEAEMLRAICGSLHCPLPPIVTEQAVSV